MMTTKSHLLSFLRDMISSLEQNNSPSGTLTYWRKDTGDTFQMVALLGHDHDTKIRYQSFGPCGTPDGTSLLQMNWTPQEVINKLKMDGADLAGLPGQDLIIEGWPSDEFAVKLGGKIRYTFKKATDQP